MIVTRLELLTSQIAITPALGTALSWLASARDQNLPDGRVEIDGSKVYALVQSYDSKPEPRFEAHRRYLDIQYIVSGKEQFGWTALENLVPADPYNPEKDVVKGSVAAEAASFVKLSSGYLAVVWPADAHAPGMADGEPSPVKKIVVKVILE